ncbi:type II secretion system F family protein [Adhaeretor mobilis]|uniref:General secretion pathway protein F n=1 Tax=Adhaeretor mobilis TaxID=1930276 RepID=A0A517MUP4_9BACT|nr:type II secretion system F family protein [Adhaeretor mobilis]QDS98596.1 Type II secretion system protein F [Adhaeretor mobilis]
MPDFAYIARNETGQRVEGVLEGASQRDVLASLSAQGLFPLKVNASSKDVRKSGGLKVRPQAMSRFYTQLAGLLRSGVPLLRSLDVLKKQSSNPSLKEITKDLHSRISEGDSLADAMARHPRAFDELSRSIVRAGGEGGFLEEALERVAKFADQQAELKARVLGAMAYPIFLAVFGVSIVTILVIFFVPKFEGLFARLRERGELPAVTDMLLWLSDTLSSYGLIIAAALVGIYLFTKAKLSTDAGRLWLDRWQLKIPQAGKIYGNLAVSRFCRVLGTLLAGGVPIVKSLKISSDSTGNRVLSEAVNEAAENITAGESLAEPLAASGHFPTDVVEMIAVAEQSNTLETVLGNVADSLEKETWRRLDLFVRLLEPVMLVILASAVLVIVIALLLPILKTAMTM